MSKPDTNQASEDEIRTLDDILSQAFTDGASDTMWQNDKHVDIFATAKKELEALLRTEKLKLLAEVRERVVGRNQQLPKRGEIDPDIYVEVIHIVEGRNSLRAEQREQLNKLEAEL